MSINNKNYIPEKFLQFSPCVFLLTLYFALYLYLYLIAPYNFTEIVNFTSLSIFATCTTIIYSCCIDTQTTPITKKIDLFLHGAFNPSLCYFYAIFISMTSFIYILAKIGALLTAITLHITWLPSFVIMPAIFIIASILSFLMKSSIASILLYVPIAYGIALSLQINIDFMIATVISGVLCGYQIYSSCYLQKHPDVSKRITQLILPACIATVIILSTFQYKPLHEAMYKHLQTSLCMQDYLSLLPILIFLIAVIMEYNLLVCIITNSIIGILIGVIQHKISYFDGMTSLFEGFYSQKSMVEILILCILLSGLIKIITTTKGFDYIINKLKIKTKKSYLTELIIILLLSLINSIISLHSLSDTIMIQISKNIRDRYHISYARIKSLFFIISTTFACFLPYTPIVLMATSIVHIPSIRIIPYMIYPIVLYSMAILSVFIFPDKKSIL